MSRKCRREGSLIPGQYLRLLPLQSLFNIHHTRRPQHRPTTLIPVPIIPLIRITPTISTSMMSLLQPPHPPLSRKHHPLLISLSSRPHQQVPNQIRTTLIVCDVSTMVRLHPPRCPLQLPMPALVPQARVDSRLGGGGAGLKVSMLTSRSTRRNVRRALIRQALA